MYCTFIQRFHSPSCGYQALQKYKWTWPLISTRHRKPGLRPERPVKGMAIWTGLCYWLPDATSR